MTMEAGERMRMGEMTYGWYPPAYDMYKSSSLKHYPQYDSQCYYDYRNSKFNQHPVSRSSDVSMYHKPNTSQGIRSTHNVNLSKISMKTHRPSRTDLQLTISTAPIVRKTSPIPSAAKVWAMKIRATPIVYPEPQVEPSHVSETQKFSAHSLDTWSVNLSYLSQADIIANTCMNEKKTEPIYRRVNPPYETSLPIYMKSAEFGIDNKLSPYNENIIRPVTDPQFYKRGPKISLVPYISKKIEKSTSNVAVPRFTPVSASPGVVDDIPIFKYKIHAPTPPPRGSRTIETTPRRCSSAPVDAPRTRPQTCRQRPESAAPVVEVKPAVQEPVSDYVEPESFPNVETDDTVSVEDDIDDSLYYDDAVEKYGWRAQIPGDPYGLVKLKDRPKFSVTCSDPVIPPDPPVARRVNFDTFFINTIPSRPKMYVVNKEWASEQLLAERLKLQRREPIYQFKKFAFAY